MAREAARAGARTWPGSLGRLRRGREAGVRGALSTEGLCLAATVGAAILVFSALLAVSLQRWQNFETNAYDLAFFDQVIWNSARGQLFENTFVPYSYAGEHIQPALLLFVPAYWLGAGPMFLVTAQVAVATLASVPLYWFARRAGLAPAVALAAAVAYLANPYLYRSLLFDFHVETMAALPFFLAAWAVLAGRPRLAVAGALSLLLFKEDAVFMVLALCGLMWARGYRKQSTWTGGIAVAITAVSVLVVMPYYRDGAESGLVERYGYLLPWRGDGGLLAGLVLAPVRALERLTDPGTVATVALFLGVSCLAGLARPKHLAWLAPGLALALLSNHPPQRELEFHYAAELVPVAAMLAALGAARMAGRLDSTVLLALLAGPALVGVVLLDPLGEARGDPPSDEHVRALHAALALIPDDPEVPVAAQSGLLPRLSQREQAYEFPSGINEAEWFLLDDYGFRSSQSLAGGFDQKREELRREAELVFAQDGVEVYRMSPPAGERRREAAGP